MVQNRLLIGVILAMWASASYAMPSPCEVCSQNSPVIDEATVGNDQNKIQVRVHGDGQVRYQISRIDSASRSMSISGQMCPSASSITNNAVKESFEKELRYFTEADAPPPAVVGFGSNCQANQKRQISPDTNSDVICPIISCLRDNTVDEMNFLVRDFEPAENGNRVRAIASLGMVNITINNELLKVRRETVICSDGSSRTLVTSGVTDLTYEFVRNPLLKPLNSAGTPTEISIPNPSTCTSIWRTRPLLRNDCNIDLYDYDNLPAALPDHCRLSQPLQADAALNLPIFTVLP